MRMRRTFKSLKFLIYLLGLISLLCMLMGVNQLRPKHVFHTPHVFRTPNVFHTPHVFHTPLEVHKMAHLVYSNKTSEHAFKSSPLSKIAKLHEWNKTFPEWTVDARKPSNDTVKVQGDTEKELKDIAKLSKNTHKPMPGQRTYYTVMEFMNRAKKDTSFQTKLLNQPYLHPKSKNVLKRYFAGENYAFNPEFKTELKERLNKLYDVNSDVMVFLHIQKTGGTHLNDRFVRELTIPFKCNCAKQTLCPCLNPKGNVWIYTSKFSGWPCGLHADWTQLHRCLPGHLDQVEKGTRNRRYFYFTQLRDPIGRYISEFYHQSYTGGHWQDALLGCGPGFSDWADIRPCFVGENWKGVTLDTFMACQFNLATNRMTRMLADLNKSNCYRKYLDRNAMRKRAMLWVESAKENLQQMEYFGFMEEAMASDKLFSHTFKMQFKRSSNKNTPSRSSGIRMNEKQFLKLVTLIELDIHIYLFAKDLFESRLRTL